MKPNIILIVLDCVRADHLSCYGYHRQTTPHIDQLATESTLFQNAFTVAPWTGPSIASLFTGTVPSRHLTNQEKVPLNPNLHTMAETLQSMGYTTIGYTNNPWINPLLGFDKGFEIFETVYNKEFVIKENIFQKLIRKKNDIERFLKNRMDYGAYLTNKKVKKRLARYMSTPPFFLYIHYNEVHEPYHPPVPFIIKYTPKEYKVWHLNKINQVPNDYLFGKVSITTDEFGLLRDMYDGAINYLDHMLGELFCLLRANGILDETILIITSDHGQNNGDHNLYSHKLCLYDTLLHIPLIIRYPKMFPPGHSVPNLIRNIDIFPTLLDILNVHPESIREQLQGESIFSIMEGDVAPFLVAEYYPQPLEEIKKEYPDFDFSSLPQELKAIRTDGFKYIWSSKGQNELYHIMEDPNELHNQVDSHPEKANELKTQLFSWIHSFGSEQYQPEPLLLDRAMKKKLRALGYMG